MAEKNKETKQIGELNRDVRKEEAASINDNVKLCEEINKGIKKEFDGKAEAKTENNTIVIYYNNDIIASYGENGLKGFTRPDIYKVVGNIISEYKLKEQAKEEKEHNKENSIKDEIENDNDNKEKEEKPKTEKEMQEQLENTTGIKYELQAKITYTGNEEIVDKIKHLEGFVGDIYTAKNMETGKYTIVGIGKDGNPKELDEYRFRTVKTGTEEITENRVNGERISKGHDSDENIRIDDNTKLEFDRNGNPSAILNNKERIKIGTEPMNGQYTTKEMDEMKKDPESMHLIDEKLNEMVNDGLINKEKSEKLKEDLSKNNKTPEEDLKDLEDLEEKLIAEKEKEKEIDESRFPEGPWDRADLGRPRG